MIIDENCKDRDISKQNKRINSLVVEFVLTLLLVLRANRTDNVIITATDDRTTAAFTTLKGFDERILLSKDANDSFPAL